MNEETDNRKPEAKRRLAPVSGLDDLSVETAKKQFSEIIGMMKNEANRLTALVESGKISVPEYKRMVWEHLGISPHCIKEGVSYVIKPESSNTELTDRRGAGSVE